MPQLTQTIRYGYLVRQAREAVSARGIADRPLAAAMPALESIVTHRICRQDIVMAGMRLLLRNVDKMSVHQNDADWAETLGFAETYLRHGIGCLPQEGDLWLRLAMIRNLRVSLPEEVATLFNMSQMLAPNIPEALVARVAFARQLSPQALRLTKEAREADMTVLCSPVGADLRRSLPNACSPNGAKP